MEIDWVQADVTPDGRLEQLVVHVQPPEGSDPDDVAALTIPATHEAYLAAAADIISALSVAIPGAQSKVDRKLPVIAQFRRDISHDSVGHVRFGSTGVRIGADDPVAPAVIALLDQLAASLGAQAGKSITVRVAVEPPVEDEAVGIDTPARPEDPARPRPGVRVNFGKPSTEDVVT